MTEKADDPRRNFITREESSDIALAAAKEASRQVVNDVFALLGVNLANFDSVQAFRDDIEWARRSRKISEMTGKRIWTTIVGIASAGIAVTLWEWAHALFHKGP